MRILVWFAFLLLAGCQPAQRAAAPAVLQPLQPPAGAAQYTFDAVESLLIVKVYRAGTMAELGHNHIVSSAALGGELYLAEPLDQTVFEVRVPVADFDVDLPELRAAAGEDFPGELSESAVAGTRDNLLGERQLDAANWPDIILRGRGVRQAGEGYVVTTDIAVRDHVHRLDVPVQYQRREDGALLLTGAFSVLQTELGLEPFSVMMGALQVRDQLDIEFSLVAVPR